MSSGTEPEVFEYGDTYILARHGVCQKDCCEGLKNNGWPDHSCPHPRCCSHEGPTGVREYSSVMGDGWSWDQDRGIGRVGGLRGDVTYSAVDT